MIPVRFLLATYIFCAKRRKKGPGKKRNLTERCTFENPFRHQLQQQQHVSFDLKLKSNKSHCICRRHFEQIPTNASDCHKSNFSCSYQSKWFPKNILRLLMAIFLLYHGMNGSFLLRARKYLSLNDEWIFVMCLLTAQQWSAELAVASTADAGNLLYRTVRIPPHKKQGGAVEHITSLSFFVCFAPDCAYLSLVLP